MAAIATISKDDMALWQRIFKKDSTRVAYKLFLGQSDAPPQYAAQVLVEKLVDVTQGDSEAVERLVRQANINQRVLDGPWGRTTWLRWVIGNTIKRRYGRCAVAGNRGLAPAVNGPVEQAGVASGRRVAQVGTV